MEILEKLPQQFLGTSLSIAYQLIKSLFGK